ncbi:cysteine-rich CWC family protein [Hydrogenophaga sp.]|uniref:cysteine-rich CWC family protein n=1 Tax=Hydrogenophaga sp. TaxID=1904254 RepID=UPI0025C5CEC8|nr:cysteine-rich CWC family protein [Hydrogenophaga sp.]
MTLPPPTVDPNRCPLCGGDNRCAMEIERATGQAQPPCWCLSQVFAPELLARLPPRTEGLACICARCVAVQTSGDLAK